MLNHRGKLFLLAAVTSLLTSHASAHVPTKRFTLIDKRYDQRITWGRPTYYEPRDLALMDAITWESRLLRQHWGTPVVRWGGGGYPVIITDRDSVVQACGGGLGCHWPDEAVAEWWPFHDGTPADGGWVTAHEVLETLVDPGPVFDKPEVCDDVNGALVTAPNGVELPDFLYPSYFDGGPGPYDLKGWQDGPLGTPKLDGVP